MIGPALAYGTAQAGARVLVLDEGDGALRAARGNFGLVWFQGKGVGMQPYADWTRQSVTTWPHFAAQLSENTGIDVDLRQNGGLDVCLNEQEAKTRIAELKTLAQQSPDDRYEGQFLSRADASEVLGGLELGPTVLGATYSPLDGHVNPLKLLRALHAGLQNSGGQYRPSAAVRTIEPATGKDAGFTVKTDTQSYTCARVLIAAGLGIPALAPAVGLNVPVFPRRGQILVTERARDVLRVPFVTIRQTAEGSIMLGDSSEDVGLDPGTSAAIGANIAARAIATLPMLGKLNLVRTWGALRILTPDHAPIYDQSISCPGAFVATSHSGVTLAAANVDCAADWLLEDRAPAHFKSFATDRFHAEAT